MFIYCILCHSYIMWCWYCCSITVCISCQKQSSAFGQGSSVSQSSLVVWSCSVMGYRSWVCGSWYRGSGVGQWLWMAVLWSLLCWTNRGNWAIKCQSLYLNRKKNGGLNNALIRWYLMLACYIDRFPSCLLPTTPLLAHSLRMALTCHNHDIAITE